MKKLSKILYVALAVMVALTPTIFAGGIVNQLVDPDITNQTEVENLGNTLTGIIKVVGVFVSVGAMMIIGIKYMMGSAEEKAEYKKVMIPYLIGALLVFGASVFADKIAGLATKIF